MTTGDHGVSEPPLDTHGALSVSGTPRRRLAAFLAVAFGEMFGWRAFLLPTLLPLGPRRAVLLHGLVWGV